MPIFFSLFYCDFTKLSFPFARLSDRQQSWPLAGSFVVLLSIYYVGKGFCFPGCSRQPIAVAWRKETSLIYGHQKWMTNCNDNPALIGFFEWCQRWWWRESLPTSLATESASVPQADLLFRQIKARWGTQELESLPTLTASYCTLR